MRWIVVAIALVAAALASGPAVTQSADKVYRLGVLSLTRRSGETVLWQPYLAARGFIEGRNLLIEQRFGGPEQLPGLARELVALKSDVIVAIAYPALEAAQAATSTIPLVMFMSEDPTEFGFAASLARPGGNVTGVMVIGAALDAKRLQLLHETVPAARRIAALAVEPRRHAANIAAVRRVAAETGLEFRDFYAASPVDFPAAVAAMRAAGVEALVVVAAPELYRNWSVLRPLLIEARIAAVCQWREMAEEGCLLGYGPNFDELRRRVADYVARILGGARPGELPIEQPTHFEFGLNMKTAHALGIEVPPSVVARANEVVE